MKRFSIEPIRNWFGYTRRERRASTTLLILIVATIFIRFIVPDKQFPVEEIVLDLPGEITEPEGPGPGIVIESHRTDQSYKKRESGKLIDLNTCDSAALESLPGIGPVLSARIIKYRNLLGGFASVDQLREVYGLQEETFRLISSRVRADSASIIRFDINAADFKRLIRLPYLDKYEVNAILKYREIKGRIGDLYELVDNKLVTLEKSQKIRPYLKF